MAAGREECQAAEQREFLACVDEVLEKFDTNGAAGPGLMEDDINDLILEKVCSGLNLKLKSWREIDMDSGGSILQNQVAARNNTGSRNILGFRSYDIIGSRKCDAGTDEEEKFTVVLKSKASVIAISKTFAKMAGKLDPELVSVFEELNSNLARGDSVSPLVELRVGQLSRWRGEFREIMLQTYATEMNPEKDQYYFIMEMFDKTNMSHIDTVLYSASGDAWTYDVINTVLEDIAGFHAAFLDKLDDAKSLFGYTLRDRRDRYEKDPAFPLRFLQAGIKKFPNLLTRSQTELGLKLVSSFPAILERLKKYPSTLIHGDFSPRNVCMRRRPAPGQKTLCVYDWELLSIHIPQYDVVEFLVFVMNPETDITVWHEHIQFYRKQLRSALEGRCQELIDDATDFAKFSEGFELAVMECVGTRLVFCFILMAAGVEIPFARRLFRNTFQFLESIAEKYEFLR